MIKLDCGNCNGETIEINSYEVKENWEEICPVCAHKNMPHDMLPDIICALMNKITTLEDKLGELTNG